jgi:hypothetical protein
MSASDGDRDAGGLRPVFRVQRAQPHKSHNPQVYAIMYNQTVGRPATARPSGVVGEMVIWRREWDSNPRYAFTHTRFPSVRLKPLGHLSGASAFLTRRGMRRKSSPFSTHDKATSRRVAGPGTPALAA